MRSANFVVVVALWLVACTNHEPVREDIILALGTTVSISVYKPPANYSNLLEHTVKPLLANYDQKWRSFGPGELGVVNDALAQQRCAAISEESMQLLRRALDMRNLSNGLFDPTLGMDVAHWGFDRADKQSSVNQPRNSNTRTTKIALRRDFAGTWQICTNTPSRIDLGGIAKGQIVANLVNTLVQHGVKNAVINAGGDLFVLGKRGRRPWRIAIQHPRRQGVIFSVDAHDGEAYFTSGDYYRYREIDNKRYHHILDPRTRAPANQSIAVTVIHSDPVVADAAATALFVGGPEQFLPLTQSFDISDAVLIDQQKKIHAMTGSRFKGIDKLQ